jgi:hypothetical protein
MRRIAKTILLVLVCLVLSAALITGSNWYFGWPCGPITESRITKILDNSICSLDEACVVVGTDAGHFACRRYAISGAMSQRLTRLITGLHCGPPVAAECLPKNVSAECDSGQCRIRTVGP